MAHDLLQEILILLATSVIFITFFRRFRLPSIISYLAVGIITGPYALAWISDSETARLFGEIGVVFLLFTIGLDFSITQFRAMKTALFGLGGTQVVIGTLSGGIIAWLLGISWQGALIVGGALALSSTAIVVKQLSDQLELQTGHGRLAFSILLFQDIAAVPFLVIIPLLAQGEALGWPLFLALLKGIFALITILIIGRWALRPMFHEIASSRSSELFTLTVLLVSLTAAWATAELGLSLAFGAFLVGMMLSETEYRHQIEVEIRPFRDVLLGIFFITVGLQLDLSILPVIWPWVLLLLAGLVIGKGFVIYLLLRLTGYDDINSFRTGITLAQAGEFSIALLVLAVYRDLVSSQDSQAILVAVILSMALAPILIRYSESMAKALFSRTIIKEESNTEQLENANKNTKDHVVICGFGRVGQTIAKFLIEQEVDFVGLDLDPKIIKSGWRDGESVFFGDATRQKILEAAKIDTAQALVICVDEVNIALKILNTVRQISGDIPVLVRSRDETSIDTLLDAGADEVIPETLEAGTTLVTQLLLLLNKSPKAVYEQIKVFHSKRYPLLKGFFKD